MSTRERGRLRAALVRAREVGRKTGVQEERIRVLSIATLVIAFDVPVALIVRGIESGISGARLASRLRASDRPKVDTDK